MLEIEARVQRTSQPGPEDEELQAEFRRTFEDMPVYIRSGEPLYRVIAAKIEAKFLCRNRDLLGTSTRA